MVNIRIIVEGSVQGIGYRAYAKYYAQRFGLKGIVRNLPDGNVELYCEGKKAEIDSFVKSLYIETDVDDPASPNVTKIDTFSMGSQDYKPAWKEYDGFEIDYGNFELTPLEKANFEDSELAKLQFWYLRNEVKLLRADTNKGSKLVTDNIELLRADTNKGTKSVTDNIELLRTETNKGSKSVTDNIELLRADTNKGSKLVTDNIESLKTDTNNNFNLMAAKYGSISQNLSETKKELTTAFKELPDRLVKALINGLKEMDEKK